MDTFAVSPAPGHLVRYARARAELTQGDLADRVGTTQSAIARLEAAGANPRVDTLARALHAAGHRLELHAAREAGEVDELGLAARQLLTPAERLRAFEASAQRTATWSVPGGVQTAARALGASGILRRLATGGVDFVVVGGVAAVLHGSTRSPRSLEICFAHARHSLAALATALSGLRARTVDARARPDDRALREVERLAVGTTEGELHLIATPPGAPSYPTLRRLADRFDLGDFTVAVAALGDLIAMKRDGDREADRADAEELETIARLRGRR